MATPNPYGENYYGSADVDEQGYLKVGNNVFGSAESKQLMMFGGVALIVAVIVVVIFLIVWYSKSGFEVDPQNAYVMQNRELVARAGYRNDAYKQIGALTAQLERTNTKPEQIAQAESEAWFESQREKGVSNFDPTAPQDAGNNLAAEHAPGSAMDYQSHITDLIIDPRTRDNHRKWASEVRPFSGVAKSVDTLDLENYVDFRGLRRPQAVAQNNPLMVTEMGADDLSGNKKFNFMG